MTEKNEILAIIPARGGSKGIKKKNIKYLDGFPLINWTINVAKKVEEIDKIIVSTDNREIAMVAKKSGIEVPLLRPKILAKDSTPMIDVVLDILKKSKIPKYLLLLQPTSPLKTKKDIQEFIKFVRRNKLDSAASVVRVKDYPELMYFLGKDAKLKKRFKLNKNKSLRQDYDILYKPNGAMYMIKPNKLIKHKSFIYGSTYGYPMPHERSVDIDDIYDWELSKLLLKNRKRN